MKLKRVELFGFKSFAERTTLAFDEGITAILGPNGCGKTNIVDAIRWVLGEQSAKQLRGERMEDIIFKGTTKRKAVGLAEVAVTFTNDDHGIPVEFDEVTIKRRVQRDGFSQYFLNNSAVRLKDLRDLFYNSGVNNAAYSIIELAMINQVLNENTQELRHLLEEGSGITKYKARRRETERKLEQTEQDLLRLRDLVDEIGREVRSLARQVGKARRYQRLFQEIRALDLLLAGQQHREFGRREEELRGSLDELRVLAEADAGELAELRTRIEAARPALEEREAERRGLEDSLRAFEEELQETERRALTLEHRIGEQERRGAEIEAAVAAARRRRGEVETESAALGARLETVRAELAQVTEEVRRREEALQELAVRFETGRQALAQAAQLNLAFIETDNAAKGLQRELAVKQENRRERLRVIGAETAAQEASLADAAARAAGTEEARQRLLDKRREMLEALAGLEREREEAVAAAGDLRQQLSAREARREALRSRHELLQRIRDEYSGYGHGARRVLQAHREDGRVLGSLAERLQVEPAYAEAFENLFAELIDAVLVDGHGTALDLVRELRADTGGRASFLCHAAAAALPAGPGPAGGRPASNFVRGDGLRSPHLARLLAQAWVFDEETDAVAAAAAHAGPAPLICLARSGLVVTSDGAVRGGSGRGEEASLLGREEKLERLEAEIGAVAAEAEAWGRKVDANAARQSELQEYVLRGRGELQVLEEDLGRLHVEAAEERSREAAARDRLAALAGEREAAAAELAALTAEEASLRGRLDESGRQRSDSAQRLDELESDVAAAERERDDCRRAGEELRLRLSRLDGERREIETALAHQRDSAAELDAREERLSQEAELGLEQLQALGVELTERRQVLASAFQERERRRQLVQAASEAIRAAHGQTEAWHDRVKAIEDQRGECRERSHGCETELATLEVKRRNLVDRVEEQYKGAFGELVRAVDAASLPRELERDGDTFQADQAAALLADRREKLGGIGPVNHLAIEEYETKKERLKFLEVQLRDVEKAKDDLVTAINQINRTARQLFADTFEEVRRNFISVFTTLFEGGRADLELIRTDDPLESHIHIVAQPRGKLVDHVGLLSGGERCLTALSLLFAVYLVKPAPFCLLDEVDGPLDDANTTRFIRMLHQFSKGTQFLVVTHNKLTMEAANHLYGVTMMEAGASSIVSVTFQDVAQTRSDDELGRAIAARRHELDRQAVARAILAGGDEEERPARFTLADDGAASPGEDGAPAAAARAEAGAAMEGHGDGDGDGAAPAAAPAPPAAAREGAA